MSGTSPSREFEQTAHFASPRRACVALLLALLASAWTTHTPAQAPAGATPAKLELPALDWKAPEGCPSEEQVRARVAALLPTASAVPAGAVAAVHASGVVTQGRAGFKLVLSVSSSTGTGGRTLQGDDCEALSDTAAWLVALTVDPNAPETPVTAPPAPEAPRVPETPPPKPPAPPPKPALEVPSDWSLQAGVFGGVWQGDRPALLRGQIGGALGVGWRMLELELRLADALPRNHRIDSGGYARSNTQSYGLASCALFAVFDERLRAGPCATLSMMVMPVESHGVSDPKQRTAVWAAVGFGAQVAYEVIRHLEVFGEGGVTAPASARPNFKFDGEDVFSARSLGAYGRLGVRFRWALPPRSVR